MLSRQFKTPYGMKIATRNASRLRADFNNGISHDQLITLHRRVLQDISTPNFSSEGYGISLDSGQTYTFEQLLDLFESYKPLLRIHVIGELEDYFTKHGTNPDQFFAAHKAGEADAKAAFTYCGVFPVEATNVRTELHHPSYMQTSAMSDELELVYSYLLSNEDGEISSYFSDRGPFLPPIPEAHNEKITRHFWKMVDWSINNGTLTGPRNENSPSPSNFH